jgi:glycosyltransferase involved in cell wall biosynthesis
MVRRRILISAYEYHPKGVSEAWAAYQLVATLRGRGYPIVVATRATPNKPRWAQVVRVKCVTPRTGGMWPVNYLEFTARSIGVARRLKRHLALIQHGSPVSLRVPNALALLDVPFIWGPVGGCIAFPPGFEHYARAAGPLNRLRRLDALRLRLDPTLIATQRRAARIVVTSSMAAEMIPDAYANKTVVIPDGIAGSHVLLEAPEEQPYIFSSGRFLAYKAFDLLIAAFAQLRSAEGVKLVISGGGPEGAALARDVERLGLRHRVQFCGWIPKQDNQRLMSRALFCVYPSLKEAFGHVNLEAMAAHKPIIVTDWAGPRDLVVEGVTGFKVLGANAKEHVAMLASAMQRLLDDRALRLRMGAAAACRLKTEYTWEHALADRYARLYEQLGVASPAVGFAHASQAA